MASIDSLSIQLTASTSKANAELTKLTTKLNTLNKSLAKTGLSSGLAGIGQTFLGISAALPRVTMGLGKFTNAGKTTVKTTKGMSRSLASLYANFWSLKRITSGVLSGVKGSMDLVETYHYFDVAMSKIGEQSKNAWAENGYDSAEAYAKSFRDRSIELNEKMSGFTFSEDGVVSSTGTKSLGMDPDMVMQYQAQYAQMADSIGMTGEAALATSKAMTMLAGDWSSLRNLDFETSYQKMASALAGQSRAVRSLGIDITQAALQQTAYNIGLTTSVTNMDQATKAQLRMITILDQSRVAWGDLAATLNQPANQLRFLQQNFISLSRTIGGIFLPIVETVLPYINGLVIALQRLFEWVAGALGIDLEDTISSMGGFNDDILGGLGDEADSATDSLEGTDDAVKKLKRTILGFDELNVLADNSDTGSSSAGTSGIGGLGSAEQALLDGALQKLLEEYEKVWNDAFQNMTSKAEEFAKKLEEIGKTVRNYIENRDFEGLGEYLASGVNYVLDKMAEALNARKILDNLYPIIDAFTGTFNSLVDNINFNRIGSILANGINIITGIISRLTYGIDWQNLGRQLATGFNTMLREVNWTKVGEGLTWRFRLAWGMLRGFVYELDEKDLGRALGRVFDGAVASINWAEVGDTIAKAFEKMWGAFRVFLSKRDRYTSLGAKFASLLNHAISVKNFESAGEVIAKSFNRLFDVLKGFIEGTDSEGGFNWQELSDAMEAGFKSFVENIKIAEAAEILNKLFKELLNAIDEAIDEEDWQTFGKDIGEAIANIDWLTHLKTAVDIIGKALGSLFVGIAEGIFGDFGENFAQGFIDGIQGILDLGAAAIETMATALEKLGIALDALNPDLIKSIGTAFATVLGAGALYKVVTGAGTALKGSWLGKAFLGTGTAGAGTAAAGGAAAGATSGGLFSLIKKGATGLLGKEGLSAVVSGAKTGALYTLPVTIADAVQRWGEKQRGLNGILTESGTVLQDTATHMTTIGQLTDEQNTELTNLIDNCENSGKGMEETIGLAVDKLGEYGVSQQELVTAVNNTVTNQSSATGALLGEAERLGEGFNTLTGKINLSYEGSKISVKDACTAMSSALNEMASKGNEDVESMRQVWPQLLSTIKYSTGDAQTAFESMFTALKNQGLPDSVLNQFIGIMQTKFPEAVSTGTTSASGSISTLAQNAITKYQSITTEAQKVIKGMDEIGTAGENADKKSENIQSKMKKWGSPLSGLFGTLFLGAMGGGVKTVGENSETSTGQVDNFNTSIEGIDKDEKGQTALGNIKTGFEGVGTSSEKTVKTVNEKVGGLAEKLGAHAVNIEAATKKDGLAVVQGLENGVRENIHLAENAVGDMWRQVSGSGEREMEKASPSKVMYRQGVYVVQGLINGLGSMTSSLQTAMNSVVYYIKSPFEGVARDIVSNFNGLGYNISRAVGSLYEVGRGLSYSLAAGFQSHHIILPHFGWNYSRIGYGNGGYFDIPNIWVNWYAKGGLFTDPTIAGFGEAGDEAALPLTNKQTMRMISDSIVDSGGALSNGMSRDDVIEAVSTGVAMALGQNPQTVEVVVNSVLKTSDEKLAQSVSRGQARLNQRYNMAY